MKHKLSPIYSLLTITAVNLLNIHPVQAAENIVFKLGLIKKSIAIKSIEQFATEDRTDDDISFITKNLPSAQKVIARELLTFRLNSKQWNELFQSQDLPPANTNLYFTRMLDSNSGKELLYDLGKIVRLADGRNGREAIRSGLFAASANLLEFTPINILRSFPGDIYIDVEEVFKVLNQSEKLTKSEIALTKYLENARLNNNQKLSLIASDQLSEISQKVAKTGSFAVSTQTIRHYDTSRNRRFTTKLYLPKTDPIATTKIPLIIIANGMGLNQDFMAFLANHLASHGFAVGVPDAIGSNDVRQLDFFLGHKPVSAGNFDASEYVNRPLDITYVLNELDRLNPTNFQNRLDIKQVGILSYSFGAVPALSLAGAKFDFGQLQQDCESQFKLINLSLFYQCRALELPDSQRNLDFRDSRITSLFMFVPMGQSLFGPKNLQAIDLPTYWNSTAQDPFTPMAQEQLPGFTAMQNPSKYLSIALNVGHTPRPAEILEQTKVSEERINQRFKTYLEMLSTAFFKVHLAGEENYRPYLSSSDNNKLSVPANDQLLRRLKN
jgi:predicted dienelactone hydrolase